MNRRKFLVVGGLGLGAGGGYTGWNWYHSPMIPDSMIVDTLYVERDILTPNSSRDNGSLAWQEEYHDIIEGENAAINEFTDDSNLNEFVGNTNFNKSYLLLVQNGMQSQPELVVDAIERIDTGLHLDISIDAPWFGVDDDLITHSLLVRITDEEAEIPEEVTLDIEGYV